MPTESRAGGIVASIALHLLILLFLIGPFFIQAVVEQTIMGAGGPGPAGGGGGGNNGTGGVTTERLRYVQITPPPPQPVITATPVIPPPEVKKPEPEPPKPEPPKATPAPEAPKDAAVTSGTGGGTGHDGTAGTGPGTGGGSGSGQGTGKGSNVGPGTGGGDARIYPPRVTTLAILPLPVPNRIRPYKLVACFEVDEKGKARLLSWTSSRDSDYDRKVKAMLEEVRFKPATNADFVPVKVTDCSVGAEAT